MRTSNSPSKNQHTPTMNGDSNISSTMVAIPLNPAPQCGHVNVDESIIPPHFLHGFKAISNLLFKLILVQMLNERTVLSSERR